MYQTYQVQYSDTIESIANKYNIEPSELEILNANLMLIPGNYIVVPSKKTNYKKYIVQKGDTIYKIAAQNNIDPNTFILLNGLNKDDYIYPNEEVIIPEDGFGVIITNENTTLQSLNNTLDLNDLISINDNIYLLPQQTILYRKE